MVMLAAPAVLDLEAVREAVDRLAPEDRSEIDRLADRVLEIFSFLGRADNETALETLLDAASRRFFDLNRQMVQMLVRHEALDALLTRASAGMASVLRTQAEERREFFSPESYDALLAAIDSLEEFLQWVRNQSGLPSGLQREAAELTVLATYWDALKAQLCIAGCVLAATGRIQDWNPRSIDLLAEAADRHMESVEDHFLAGEAPAPREEQITLDQARAELGLRG